VVQEVTTIVNSRLEEYPFIKRYLLKIIRDRLKLPIPDRGILVGSLLDEGDSATDLKRLERALQFGESHCQRFKHVFDRMGLPLDQVDADGRIIDVLAEVKVFEWLYSQGFDNITYLEQKSPLKNVDFTATRRDCYYAVEVTRLGLPRSSRKKPVYLAKGTIPHHDIPGVRNLEGEFFIMAGPDNVPAFEETFAAAISRKYPQIREFCERQARRHRGILALSVGRDYFVSRYARRDMDMFPRADYQALKLAWESQREDIRRYLHHVVFIPGKNLAKVLIYPSLDI